jgi:hypothetical protein
MSAVWIMEMRNNEVINYVSEWSLDVISGQTRRQVMHILGRASDVLMHVTLRACLEKYSCSSIEVCILSRNWIVFGSNIVICGQKT